MENAGSVWPVAAAAGLVVLALPDGAARSPAWRALERRVARLLGLDAGLVHELMVAARCRDDGRLALRAAAFLAATTRLSPRVVPRPLRERAVRGFVWWLLARHPDDPRVALAYAGLARRPDSRSCPGLLSS